MRAFSDWIGIQNLVDLPLGGAKYTWSNRQESSVMSRLDRFLVSIEWIDLFPHCIQVALARPTSDHCPISRIGVLLFG